MNIQKKPADVIITFSPKDYWLRKTKEYDDTFNPDFLGEYCLTHRIDMSYCGKPDQEGMVCLFMNEKQAKQFKDAGFSELIG